jgi:acetyl esterase
MARQRSRAGAVTYLHRIANTSHPPVPIRVYDAVPDRTPGVERADDTVLLWIHGGGFVGGNLGMPESDAVCSALAARGCTCIAVDYRLAPCLGLRGRRAHYPAALDDCEGAWRWLEDYAEELGMPAERRFVGGASAGGALAATLALRLRDKASPVPAGVVLAYPLLHPALPEPSPELRRVLTGVRRFGTFTPRLVSWMARAYVGQGNLDRIPEALPGGADVTDFPPTLIVNSERDSLRSSGERFAEELQASGRPVDVTFEPGTSHGHLNRPRRPGFDMSIARIANWLGKEEKPPCC